MKKSSECWFQNEFHLSISIYNFVKEKRGHDIGIS